MIISNFYRSYSSFLTYTIMCSIYSLSLPNLKNKISTSTFNNFSCIRKIFIRKWSVFSYLVSSIGKELGSYYKIRCTKIKRVSESSLTKAALEQLYVQFKTFKTVLRKKNTVLLLIIK